MARGKKKENLTPEERLQAALVPESEQPYKVPANWCWVKVGELSSLHRGVSYKKRDAHFKKKEQDCLILRGGNILEGAIETEESDNVYVDRNLVQNEQLIRPYDIIIVSSTGSSRVIGRAGVSYVKYNDVAFGAFLTLVRPNAGTEKPFIAYYFQSDLYRDRIRDLASGVNINNIKVCYITESPIPLPPLPEQKRIVACVESLFSKLDEAKEKVQYVLDSFEIRKAAILHKAFTGELTTQWRKEYGVGLENWKKNRFDEVATIKSNLVNPAEFPDFPHIAPDNIERKTGVLLEYHTIAEDGVISGKHRFYSGQILYSKIRPYLSKVVVVDFDGLCSADMYPIEAKGNTRCLWYYMLSEEFVEQASAAGSRSVLPKINQKELSSLTVSLPTSIDEQEEIVRILDGMFAREQQAKEAAEVVLEQINLIKKTILTRAFRGELGTNDPREENSVELLKRSFLEKINNEKVTSKQVIKSKAKEIFMPKTIMEALLKGVRLTPEQLKSETKLSIDDFYAQLKELIDNGKIVENRENGESYLEAANENRQIENHQF